QGNLIAPRSKDRPLIVVTKQTVCGTAHVHQVFRVGPDAAQYAKDRLNERRALYQAAIHEMGQIVQMDDVIALELEAGAIVVALPENGLDILVGILENEIAAVLQMLPLPFVIKVLEAVKHGKQAEVHGAHVQ